MNIHAIAPPLWAQQYLGIPFKLNGADRHGCDCVGLCQLVMEEQAKVVVGRSDIYVGDLRTLDPKTVQSHVGVPPWTKIIGHGEERAYDWALLWAIRGRSTAPLHVGIVTAPGWLLHVQEDVPACNQRIGSLANRIILFARHDALAT